MYTEEQFNKLPKWAQQEIKMLKGNIKALETKVAEIEGDVATNTCIMDGLSEIPLFNHSHIKFKTGNGLLNSVSVYVRKDGMIDVNTNSRIGKTMVIKPCAANAFYIDFV